MKIDVIRDTFTEVSSIGSLFVDGEFECYCLEDCVREKKDQPVEKWKINGKTAIPCGQYEVILDFSNRFHKTMPHILNVEGFTGVRIHCGNSDADTEGCLLVGAKRFKDAISECANVYNNLVKMIADAIKDGDKVYINISNKE